MCNLVTLPEEVSEVLVEVRREIPIQVCCTCLAQRYTAYRIEESYLAIIDTVDSFLLLDNRRFFKPVEIDFVAFETGSGPEEMPIAWDFEPNSAEFEEVLEHDWNRVSRKDEFMFTCSFGEYPLGYAAFKRSLCPECGKPMVFLGTFGCDLPVEDLSYNDDLVIGAMYCRDCHIVKTSSNSSYASLVYY
jgi:hypothetical protein